MFITVVPAYGRDYKSQKEVKADWDAGKDFRIQDMMSPDDGRYVNKGDAPKGATLNIRFSKLMKICVIKA